MTVQEVDDVKIPIADILKRFAQVHESQYEQVFKIRETEAVDS